LTLRSLRAASGWTTKKLATALGFADDRLIARYERGKPISRESLDRMAALLGYPPEAVEVLLSIHRGFLYGPPEEAAPPGTLSAGQNARIERAALAAGWSLSEELRVELGRIERRRNAEAARGEAYVLWDQLKVATRQERREVVEIHPEFRSWALAMMVCEESVRAAAHRAGEALELANLALLIASRVPGEESWRCRLQGYAWAHVANARRVANDFDGADAAFTQAWALWWSGADSTPELLPEWRLLDLESSLRREQQRFSEALELLDRARLLCGDDETATGRILLKTEHVREQTGDIEGALAALAGAAPFIKASGNLRLLFAHLFKTANNLCHLERYAEAAGLLPEVRSLAMQQANELDLVRVLWLEARIDTGQGEGRKAAATLEQVQREFAAHKLPYDAALSSLDLALLRLEEGRTAEVRALALGMAWIFTSKKIHREALAALALFCESAQREAVTMDLTRSVIARIEDVRRSAPRPQGRGRG
jgi:transcriptional regulator with XRE-family HTH domain